MYHYFHRAINALVRFGLYLPAFIIGYFAMLCVLPIFVIAYLFADDRWESFRRDVVDSVYRTPKRIFRYTVLGC